MVSGAVVTGGSWEGWSEGGEGVLVELEGLGEGSSTFTCAMLPGERGRERGSHLSSTTLCRFLLTEAVLPLCLLLHERCSGHGSAATPSSCTGRQQVH